jgi:endonuclease/exonuclease/phosphatase family metal-dependent hydrolase
MQAGALVRKLSVLTVNTHKGFTFFNRRFILHGLRQAVRDVAPDIVFLQEVLGEHQLHAQRFAQWPACSHYEFMADSIWDEFAYGRNAVYPHGHHGNAVLSKFPILRHDNRDVSVGPHEKRSLLHCVVQLPGQARPLHAISVHLGLRESQRQHQVDLLCRLLQDIQPGDPVVIAGDFNDWRLLAHRKLLDVACLQEVFGKGRGLPARTFPARWPLLRLDRIYVRHATAMHPTVMPRKPWSHLSDHAPLAAEIHL